MGLRNKHVLLNMKLALWEKGFALGLDDLFGGGIYFPFPSFSSFHKLLPPLSLSLFSLHNSLQLPRVANCILNYLSGRHQDFLLRPHAALVAALEPLLRREVDAPVTDEPATALACELDHAAFAVEE